MGQNLPMERCQKLLACRCGVKTSEKILTSFVDDPLLWSALGGRKAKQSRALRGQTNAMHWTNWKGVGNRVARFEESPVVRMKRLLTLNRLAEPWGQGGIPPSQILADQLTLFQPGRPYFHTFHRLCALF